MTPLAGRHVVRVTPERAATPPDRVQTEDDERRGDDENLKRASTPHGLQHARGGARTSGGQNALGTRPSRRKASFERWTVDRRNVERVSPGDEPGRAVRKGKALKRRKPQERQRHETRPQGRARTKPSRTCERSKGEGARVEPGNAPTRRSSNAEGEETSWEEPEARRDLREEARASEGSAGWGL